MKQILLIAFPLLLIFPTCSPNKTELRLVRVRYSNGALFCEGSHQVSSKTKDSVRVGLWRFYYPDSTLNSQQEYDEDGELISYNFYSDSGVLTLSGSTKEKQSLETEFFDNGKLKSETVSETSKNGDSEIEVSNIKEYYQDGNLWRESRKEDGVLDGVMCVIHRHHFLTLGSE